MEENQKDFQRLVENLSWKIDSITQFLDNFQSKNLDSRSLIFEFQLMMEQLSDIKAEADQLTRTFDHG